MSNQKQLSKEEFDRIFSDEVFRNAVAYAHRYCVSGKPEIFTTATYPTQYIVTADQIAEAARVLSNAKAEIFANHSNDLLFCSMGCTYEARYDDDVCNHRIRTEFLNRNGKRFFVEFGTGLGDNLRVDHSIDRDLETDFENKREEACINRKKFEYKSEQWYLHDDIVKKYQGQPYNNYGGLERLNRSIKYTKTNILKLVNETFECDFKNIVVDLHTIHPQDRDIICRSPKPQKVSIAPVQLSIF